MKLQKLIDLLERLKSEDGVDSDTEVLTSDPSGNYFGPIHKDYSLGFTNEDKDSYWDHPHGANTTNERLDEEDCAPENAPRAIVLYSE